MIFPRVSSFCSPTKNSGILFLEGQGKGDSKKDMVVACGVTTRAEVLEEIIDESWKPNIIFSLNKNIMKANSGHFIHHGPLINALHLLMTITIRFCTFPNLDSCQICATKSLAWSYMGQKEVQDMFPALRNGDGESKGVSTVLGLLRSI